MPRILAALALFLLLGAESRAELTPLTLRKATSLCARGSKALRSGDLEAASQRFEQALALVRDLPDAHVGLGNIAMRRQRFEEALRHYEAARAGIVELAQQLKAREFEHQRTQLVEAQILQDQIALVNAPTSRMSPGRKQMLTLNFETKSAAARQESTKSPDAKSDVRIPPELFFLIGNANARLGRLEEARLNWETCTGLDPAFAPVHNNLAVLYLQTGRLDDAQEHVVRAEQLGVAVNPQFKRDLDRALTERKPVAPSNPG